MLNNNSPAANAYTAENSADLASPAIPAVVYGSSPTGRAAPVPWFIDFRDLRKPSPPPRPTLSDVDYAALELRVALAARMAANILPPLI